MELLNLSNSFLEAMKFLPYFFIFQDLIQFLAQKFPLFSGVNDRLFQSPYSGKAVSLLRLKVSQARLYRSLPGK